MFLSILFCFYGNDNKITTPKQASSPSPWTPFHLTPPCSPSSHLSSLNVSRSWPQLTTTTLCKWIYQMKGHCPMGSDMEDSLSVFNGIYPLFVSTPPSVSPPTKTSIFRGTTSDKKSWWHQWILGVSRSNRILMAVLVTHTLMHNNIQKKGRRYKENKNCS